MRKKFLILLLILLTFNAFAGSIYVFYPTVKKPKILKQELAAKLSNYDILVFGKYIDFINQINKRNPDIIITKLPILKDIQNYEIEYIGLKDQSKYENYSLISLKPIDSLDFSEISIGVVNSLGRKQTKNILENKFKGSLNIKYVNKVEDLYPLLTFDLADVVILTNKNLNYYKKLSNRKLYFKEVENFAIENVGIAIKNKTEDKKIKEIHTYLPKDFLSSIGVENWKE